MINWSPLVRQLVRKETTWNIPVSVVADATRCGRKKRRGSLTMQPTSFAVKMLMTQTEYVAFMDWFINDLKGGVLTFGYPQIDTTNGNIVEYAFEQDSKISVSNPSGKMLEVNMQWEEV